MKIYELFEQTIAPVPPGQGQQLPPTEASPQTSNTPQTTLPTGAPPTTTAGQTPVTPPPNQQVGQDPKQAQQVQQFTDQSKQTMTDLDKIAAQIVGLKQKQEQMQQQLQKTV
jgi:uncharacterized protein YgiM (DUF1202 family)